MGKSAKSISAASSSKAKSIKQKQLQKTRVTSGSIKKPSKLQDSQEERKNEMQLLKKLMKLEPDADGVPSGTASSYTQQLSSQASMVKLKQKKLKAKARANNRLRKLNPQVDMNQLSMSERHIQSAENKLNAEGKPDSQVALSRGQRKRLLKKRRFVN